MNRRARRPRLAPLAGACCCCALIVAIPVTAAAQTAPSSQAPPVQSGSDDRSSNDGPELSLLQSVYPIFDGLDKGAGLTGGVGFRRAAGPGLFDLQYALSHRGYVGASIEYVRSDLLGGRAELRLGARFRESPQMSFFGIGNDGGLGDRTSYERRRVRAGADFRVDLGRHVFVEGGAGTVWFGTEDGDGPYPSTDTRFTIFEVPGLRTSPTFVHTVVGVGIDTRASSSRMPTGGLYQVSFNQWQSIDGREFGFNQTDIEAKQNVRLFHDASMLTVGGSASLTGTDDEDAVPHFLLPALGGSGSLRGYRNFRFQDQHSLLLSAEYRLRPVDTFEVSMFVDAGKVASRVRNLTPTDLWTAIGVGARIRGPRDTSFGFSVARGADGFRYYFSFSPKF